jgi:uncharacterized protein YidB (DUF937 family)
VQQGLGGTGLIDSVAAKAGVSPEVAKMAMAVALPMVMAHFTQGGQQTLPQSGFGDMASQILSKFIQKANTPGDGQQFLSSIIQ